MRTWSMALLLAFASLLAACGDGARLVKRTEDGGVVIYPMKHSGALLSPFRKDALALASEHCGGSYRIVREGETKGRSRISEHAGGGEVVHERRWGIEFQCRP